MSKTWYDRTRKVVPWDLKMSEEWHLLVSSFEGLRLEPYDDQTGKPISSWVKGATIGYGHLILRNEWDIYKHGISQAEADELVLDDSMRFEDAVNDLVVVGLTQYQFDALVSFCFNVGEGNLKSSTLLKCVNAEDHEAAAAEFHKWKYSQGRVMNGLIRRRKAESLMYQGKNWKVVL